MYKQTNTICKPKRIRLSALIIHCTILMKANSRFSRNVYTISDRIWCNKQVSTWLLHQMKTVPALMSLCEGNPSVTGGFPSQRPVKRSFDVLFDLRLNKRLSTQSRCRWFETPSCPLWRQSSDQYIRILSPLDCLLNNLVKSTSKQTTKLRITALEWREPPVIDGFSLLASEVNPAMVSTVRFYDRNELYGSPDVRNWRMPNFLGWAFLLLA